MHHHLLVLSIKNAVYHAHALNSLPICSLLRHQNIRGSYKHNLTDMHAGVGIWRRLGSLNYQTNCKRIERPNVPIYLA